MSVQRRDTKNGIRWDVRLHDPAGKVYNRSFRTKREADAFERAELRARDSGLWVDSRLGRQTMGEWLAEWYPAHEASLAAKTRSQYRSTLQRWVLPTLGDKALAAITPLDIQRLVNGWAKDAKASTVQHRYAVLRTALSAALLADRIGRSPCRGIKLPWAEPTRRRLPDVTELTALVEATRPEYAAMVWTGAVLGLRWGEVAGLRVGSIDFLRRQLMVMETVGEASGVIHTGPPKSAAGRRQLPVPAALIDVLAVHLALTGLNAADADRYLFPAPMGGPLRYSWWHEKVWDRARRQIGLPRLGFHDLRRVYASALVAEAIDVKVSQELMGHEDIRMTRGLYAQAGSEAKQRANEAVAASLLGPAERSASGVAKPAAR